MGEEEIGFDDEKRASIGCNQNKQEVTQYNTLAVHRCDQTSLKMGYTFTVLMWYIMNALAVRDLLVTVSISILRFT